MRVLAALRCNNHADREAAALCASCGRPQCRECVTEHAGRLLCGQCLARQAVSRVRDGSWRTHVAATIMLAVAVLSAVSFFFLVGKLLTKVPPAVHEGTIWRQEGGP
jgi:hypothetical protein